MAVMPGATPVLRRLGQPSAPRHAARRGPVAGEQDQRGPVRVVESRSSAGKIDASSSRSRLTHEPSRPSGPPDARSAPADLPRRIGGADRRQVAAQPRGLGDRVRVLGVGLGFAGERAGHPVDQPAGHLPHPAPAWRSTASSSPRSRRSCPPPSARPRRPAGAGFSSSISAWPLTTLARTPSCHRSTAQAW